MSERFSKAKLTARLQETEERLRKEWNFDRNNGHAQLGESPPKLRAIAYGEWTAARDMLNAIGWGAL